MMINLVSDNVEDLLEKASDEAGEFAMIFTSSCKFGIEQHDQIRGCGASPHGRPLSRQSLNQPPDARLHSTKRCDDLGLEAVSHYGHESRAKLVEENITHRGL